VFGGPQAQVSVAGPVEQPVEGSAAVFTLTRTRPTTNTLSVTVRIAESGRMQSLDTSDPTRVRFAVGNDTASFRLRSASTSFAGPAVTE
jgi:hypothetical protein